MGDSWQPFCGTKLWENSFPSGGLPNLSVCMQHTILVWVPTAFTLILSPILFFQSIRNSRRYAPLPISFQLILKIVLSLALTGINIYVLVHNIILSNLVADYLYSALLVASFLATTIGHVVRKQCGQVSSGIQHISTVLFLVCGGPEFYQRVREGNESPSYLSSALTVSYFIYYSLLIVYTFVLSFADHRSHGEKSTRSPELESSFLNRLTLWWFNPIPWTGARRDLEIEDLFELNEASTTSFLTNQWENEWHPKVKEYNIRKGKEVDSEKPVKIPSMFKTLLSIFKWELITATFIKIMSDTLQFANPFLLHQMLNFVSEPNSPLWQGIAYAIFMFVCSEIRSFLLNVYFYIMMRMGIKFQTTLIAAVYRKTLTLSNSARRDKTVGEIVNLMSIDVERIQIVTQQLQQVWSCPYQITLALVYLYLTLGYSAAPGIILMIVVLPMNIVCSMIVKKWQAAQMKLKDERTKMVNEVLNGMRVVKLYAWEIPMEEHIENIRQKELTLIRKSAMVRNVIDAFNTSTPFLVALFSFTTYVLSSSEHRLTPQVAFVSLTLFNQLRSSMQIAAFLINQAVNALVSNKRLKAFLVAEELDHTVVEKRNNKETNFAAEFSNFDATWDTADNKQTLTDISMKVPHGNLLAVVGKVGSGKSSLLSALLGEMGKLRGKIGISGKLAYVPQQAWIQNMTVKDNILFGKPYDNRLYQKVIHACALASDLKILPNGDMTEIGEKGINLSGGQKARISLARAVYQNYDVYLLDDPLSAVDAHVGRHIFENVIGPNGMLKNKTRILVTHGLSYVKFADEIFVLHDGTIAERGKYSKLLKDQGKFYQFLEEYKTKGSEEENKEIDEDTDIELEKDNRENEADLEGIETLDLARNSITSVTKEVEKPKLIQKENVATGKVKLAVYHIYIKAASYWRCALYVCFLIAFMSLQMTRNFWLSAWSDLYDQPANTTDVDPGYYLGVYAAIGTCETMCYLTSIICLLYGGLNASKNLHFPLIHNLMRSPMSFFETTPLGRILNRCSKDIEVVDMMLPFNFRFLVVCILQLVFTLVAIMIATPIFAVVIIPLGIIYFLFLRFYVPTSRQLKRLESTNRSPIFSHFGETVQGAPSIRAFDKVNEFRGASGALVDRFIRCKYMNIVSNRWLGVRLEFIGNVIVFFAALFAALSKQFGWVDSPGIIGVSISYAMNMTEVLNFAVRQISEIEANIVAVERIDEYTVTPNEALWELPEHKPKSNWPQSGVVKLNAYSTRYREGLDLVLKNICADVSAGEKVGIVGRTGAGKSSFALALFRMIEPAEGAILIDGVDVAKIGLHDLRSALTIIPQDPVLFSGTLRFNLDPFNTSSDADIWKALKLAHLTDLVASFNEGLEHRINEGGENISVGQRQLVCLARALLRRTKILVLDEATAAVDVATDALIQATIREQFSHCTVFTIAHRLNTILDYDRIMVLDKGQIAELDSPGNLLENRESIFSKMVADSKNEESSE